MSARIAPDSIGAVAALAVDYRPPAAPPVQNRAVAAASSSSSAGPNASSAAPRTSDAQVGSGGETTETREKTPPPLPPEQPGADYVRAVISGQLLPRPTSAQELFARVGTGWVPPESEYRLTEKIA